MAKNKPKERMIKTSIDLTSDQYQYLKIKALERKMKGQDPSFVTILRELIEEDRKKWQSKPKLLTLIIAGLLCIAFSLPAAASYIPFNTNVNMKIGIGTSTPQATLVVSSGNVGIGTWTAAGGNLIVNGGGNVGIGSAWPGQVLDVNGTARMTGFVLNNSPASGDILMSNGVGLGTWIPASAVGSGGGSSYWITGNVGINTTSNVGIGSVNPGQALDVNGTIRAIGEIVNGNVGIGTSALQTAFAVTNGNVGIGTWTAAGGNLIIRGSGNVGIGSAWPGQMLDVQGTLRTIGGIVNGNVGIGTSFVNGTGEAALTVMNGNVGIGTWKPAGQLDVEGTLSNAIFNGNVGIGTYLPVDHLNVATSMTVTDQAVSGDYVQFYPEDSASINYPRVFYQGGQSTSDTNWGIRIADAYSSSANIPVELQLSTNNNASYTGANTLLLYMTDSYASIFTVSAANGNGVPLWLTTNPNTSTPQAGIYISTVANNQNVGIATSSPGSQLSVLGGISTGSYATNTAPAGGIIASGNVGLGSTNPGQALDVQGTVRATGFVAGAGGITLGGVNNTSWPSGGSNTWTNDTGNVGINTSYSVGIGTIAQTNTLNILGNIGIGTVSYSPFLTTSAPKGGMIIEGNVGIGSLTPGQKLDIQGTVRNIGEIVNGNIGIGTSFTNNGTFALSVMNGNVGIGTWKPAGQLDVEGTLSTAIFNGNVGIGSTNPGQKLDIQGTVRNIGEIVNGNIGIGTSFVNGAGEGALTVMNGNVGIGTWTPNALLNVQGPNSGGETIFNVSSQYDSALSADNNGNVYAGVIKPGGGNIQISYDNTLSDAIDTSVNGANHYFGSSTGANIILLPGAATGGTVSGNVGIGSLTPGQTLDVQGTVRMTGFNIASGAGANKVLTSDANGNGTWGVAGAGSNYWANDTGNVGINTTSNIGIGTVSQVNSLNILGNVGIGTFSYDPYMTKAAPNGGMIVSGNVGVGTWAPAAGMDVETSGTTNFASDVGIGSLSPSANLDVVGTGHFSSNVGIGTVLSAGAVVTVGGSNANSESAASGGAGHIVCLSRSATGTACLGYCTAAILSGTGTCTCQCI